MSLFSSLRRIYVRIRVYRRFLAHDLTRRRTHGWGAPLRVLSGFTSEKRYNYPGFGERRTRKLYVSDITNLKSESFNGKSGMLLNRKDVLIDYISRNFGMEASFAQVFVPTKGRTMLASALRDAFGGDAACIVLRPDDHSLVRISQVRVGETAGDIETGCPDIAAIPEPAIGTGLLDDRPPSGDPLADSDSDTDVGDEDDGGTTVVIERLYRGNVAPPVAPPQVLTGQAYSSVSGSSLPSGRSIWLRLDALPEFSEGDWYSPQLLHLGIYWDVAEHRPFVGFATIRRSLHDDARWPRFASGFESVRIDPESGRLLDLVRVEEPGKVAVRRDASVPGWGDDRVLSVEEWQRIRGFVLRVARALPNLRAVGWTFIRVGGRYHFVDASNNLKVAYPQLHGPLLADERIRAAYAEAGLAV